MVIAVVVSLSPAKVTVSDRYFFNQALLYLASLQAQHHIYICTDAPEEVSVKVGNVTLVPVSYLNSKRYLLSLWKGVKHRQLLKKLGAEVVLYFDARLYVKGKLPYCIMVKSAEVGSKPSGRLFKAIQGAKSVLIFSEASKASICGRYRIPADKAVIVHAAGFEAHRVFEDDQIASVKAHYTSGCEYFLYTGSIDDSSSLVSLLKAFSIFKKRQKTSWKLVLINRELHPSAVFTEALRTYKYREEVVVLQENEDLSGLLSAAYAFVVPGVPDEYGLYILEAMQYGLPVLAGQHPIVAEVAGDAVLNFDGSVPDLAEKMMLLYKDENLRSHKVEAGNKVVSTLSWQRTAQEIWESLK